MDPLDEMRALLIRQARADMTTAIDGVRACRFDRADAPAPGMSGTVLAVIAQGRKRLALGEHLYEYGPGQYLVASADLPVTGHVVDTGDTRDTGRPTLGFGMTLSPAAIAELLLEADPHDLPALADSTAPPGIAVSTAPPPLLDAVVRLLRLLERPADRKILAPMVKREILWHLLRGEQGSAIRQLGLADSGLAHINRAVRRIRENYADPFRVEDLARLAGMSVSAFHRNFQTVTGMSPIQFQKRIRLQEARLLLAGRPSDISGVGLRVGYESLSQFSREYRRLFGTPPSKDTTLRASPAEHAAVLP
ncbi:AraC family transcriptional regulator [Streptomyces sp. SID3212]|uniref:AraC family transcriptional regulator n=1 Tax=Streptomyces sp. SID3212 TaxID=2690259 RepID=UPI00136A672C|nr:AraC family transcriptional regulator [Streptomyces sp. SID3212]MYV56159.1 helix-turn-helix domain-containing protein [Streptomyces sp. SID3212]